MLMSVNAADVRILAVNCFQVIPCSIVLIVTGFVASTFTSVKCTTPNESLEADTFENPSKIEPAPFKGAKRDGDYLTITLPAKSIVAIELK